MLSSQRYVMCDGTMVVQMSEVVARILQMCASQPNNTSSYLVGRPSNELVELAKDCQGSRFLQNNLSASKDLRMKLLRVLIEGKQLLPLAIDPFGNFVVQKMLNEPDVGAVVTDAVLNNGLVLSYNRYSCRVVQKLVTKAPLDRVHRLFKAYRGSEGKVVKDPNGNHIVQKIMEYHVPDVYASFMKAVCFSPGIADLMLDKYGCRVVQMCLEKVVAHCFNPHVPEVNKRCSFEVLSLLMVPILENARALSENDYANYIVQYVLRSEFLNLQRQFIIHTAILHNVLWLSQGKFSSHVVEQALCYASPQLLREMFKEVLLGYERDGRGRDALDIMLFDQYGNYVVQSLFKIAIKVSRGEREGDKEWFTALAQRVMQSESNLRRYSSGKKLLQILADIMRGALPMAPPQLLYPPTALPSFVQPVPQMSYQLSFFPPPQFQPQMVSPLPPMVHRSGPVVMPPPLLLPPLEGWPPFQM